jgi:isoleucyl-tRNA synthetase
MSAPNLKDTLRLPQTSFPMRGDLVQNEPGRLARWESEGLYGRILGRRREAGAPEFILHDGPPFANGDVHMGTALNKLLKDLVVKSKTMAGFSVPFIPGWDCHGLPIEFKVVKEAAGLDAPEIRRRCTEFAKRFIDIQRASFRRLGVFGDWENPYLTMDPGYEANILRVFAKLVEKGAVYQSKKPVQWSYGAQTALAEAEVEYQDKQSPAVFVKFPLATGEMAGKASIVIWTTTPWTLPVNLGLAVHPEFSYVVGRFVNEIAGREETLVIVKDLLEAFHQKTGFALAETVSEMKGRALEGLEARHPFLDRSSKVILANFVTTETGTGIVHIAPGHGADDYVAGQQNGLAVLSPVDDEGKFTAEVGVDELVGVHVFKSNDRIIEILAESGHLLGREVYQHSYPHCWRSKTPIIFRAVEQFFISLETLRGQALAEIDEVEWLPSWGRNRIYGTVESRPDWCISRQRTWGVPIIAFTCKSCEKIVHDRAPLDKVVDLFREHSADIWYEKTAAELLGEGFACTHCGGTEFEKERDILDVWFDSGSSHLAVLNEANGLPWPSDMYLEGGDQYRGWFHSSLLVGVGLKGDAPYRATLTNGWTLDGEGKAMSKSLGNTIEPEKIIKQYGAEILRLWVSSVEFWEDVRLSETILTRLTEAYRKIRNTFRYALGNLDGFDPDAGR